MARVSKWGNSLAVRLPVGLGFEEGQEVFVRRGEAGEVVVSPEKDEAAEAQALARKTAAIARLGRFNWKLPDDYRFDRDDANER